MSEGNTNRTGAEITILVRREDLNQERKKNVWNTASVILPRINSNRLWNVVWAAKYISFDGRIYVTHYDELGSKEL
jgi:hypothetical protein